MAKKTKKKTTKKTKTTKKPAARIAKKAKKSRTKKAPARRKSTPVSAAPSPGVPTGPIGYGDILGDDRGSDFEE